MIVTRAQIIKAIETENLRHSLWIDVRKGDDGQVVIDDACAVCAVGAILRSACGIASDLIDDAASGLTYGDFLATRSAVDRQLAEGKYMNALSCFFEGGSTTHDVTDAERAALVAFVTDNFPETIEVPL